ncbi:RNA polymerase sigma factor SigZ [Vibrio sp. WXL103]|uniref:RNA polymerase sigma factor SigZ n=1 Tax=Vibrio sp. WXL103 TaxID=3450710 RepID=UPI003EC587D6
MVWKQYRQSLRGFLSKKIANQEDVDDLLQEILLKTHLNFPSLQDSKKLKSWLFQIANHTIIDFYRKRAREKDMSVGELWHETPTESEINELAACIEPFIDQLDQDQAQLLKAVEIQGISQKVYAEQHGIKYSTLKSRVQKSRQNLLAIFNQCCEFSLDHQGNIIDYQRKPGASCGDARCSSGSE